MLTVAYLGNFEPEHSTENHVARAFTVTGHRVYAFQESNPEAWRQLRDWAERGWTEDVPEPDMVLWTRTWERPEFEAHRTIAMLRAAGIAVVGYHLDRWWGLARESQVREQAFFTASLVLTADGGHDLDFERAGVVHQWLPPGVSRKECERVPERRRDLDGKIVFVGSTGGYHPEWEWRDELIRHLRSTYNTQFVEIPGPGKPAIRGQGLVDIYAADAVFVGDSCLAGSATRYWSDRIPETLGRGGLLVHPHVEGIEDHFTPGEHLLTFAVGDTASLDAAILRGARMFATGEAAAMRAAAKQHVLDHHTYEVRAGQIISAARNRGLLP